MVLHVARRALAAGAREAWVATDDSRIVEALDDANRRGWADVLVLIRGGGSLQDLWAFNDERVADAVYRSGIPVVAGIGHEIDTSVADMVADLRADGGVLNLRHWAEQPGAAPLPPVESVDLR